MAKTVKCDPVKKETKKVVPLVDTKWTDKCFKQALKFTNKPNSARPVLECVLYEENGSMVATNDLILLQIENAWQGGMTRLYTKDDPESKNYTYPDYTRTIPHEDTATMAIKDADVVNLLKVHKELQATTKSKVYTATRTVRDKKTKKEVEETYSYKNETVSLRMVSGFKPLVSVNDIAEEPKFLELPRDDDEFKTIKEEAGAINSYKKTDVTIVYNVNYMVTILQALKNLDKKTCTIYVKEDRNWQGRPIRCRIVQPMLIRADGATALLSPIFPMD